MDNQFYGVIQEQGFVTENTGLGFKPLTESEKKDMEKKFDKKEDKKK